MKRSDWINTVATVVIALATVLAINWKMLMGTGPPLEANGESFYAPLSPDISFMLGFVGGAQEPKLSTVLTDALKDTFDHDNLNLGAAFPGELAESLSATVRSKIQTPFKGPIKTWDRITYLRIQPRALTACHDVRVHVSGAQLFSEIKNGENAVLLQGDQEVSIGNLQYEDTVHMYAWSDSGTETPIIFVKSDEGAASVKMLGETSEKSDFWDAFRLVTWGFMLPVFGVIAVIWFLLPKNARKQFDEWINKTNKPADKPGDKPDQTSK